MAQETIQTLYQERRVTPTLLLGLGGTGKQVMLQLRKRFYERYGIAGFPTVGYLCIDTNTRNYNIDDRPIDYIMQQVMFTDDERINVEIPSEAFMRYFRNQRDYPHIFTWLDAKIAAQEQVLNDAGQVRPLGRLAFFHHYAHIRKGLEVTNARISQQTPIQEMFSKHGITVDARAFDIDLICSLAGGTGSGMFLDAAFMCREAFPHAHITLYLLLPSAFASSIRGNEKIYANAYAALKELEYFSLRKDVFEEAQEQRAIRDSMAERSKHDFAADWDNREVGGLKPRSISGLFNTCYLIDNVTLSVGTFGRQAKSLLCDMIAENIFLKFSDEEFSRSKDSIRSNLEQYLGEPLTYKYLRGEYAEIFSQRFSAFGFSKLFVPVDRIRYACSFQLGLDIFDGWLIHNRLSAIEIERRLVGQDLGTLGLRAGTSRDDFMDELNKVVGRTFADEIRDWVNQQRTAMLDETKAKRPSLYAQIASLLKAFFSTNYDKADSRWENWGLPMKTLHLNTDRFISIVLGEFDSAGKRKTDGKILTRVKEWLKDDRVRLDLAVEYLKVLSKILDRHVDQYYAKAKEAAERRARDTLYDLKVKLEMIRDKQSGWLVQRRALRSLVDQVCKLIREHLVARMNAFVYETAIDVITCRLKPYIGSEEIKTDAQGKEATERSGLLLELWSLKRSLLDMYSEMGERFRSFDQVQEHMIYESVYEKGMFLDYYQIEENGVLYPVPSRLEQLEGLLLQRLEIANPYDLIGVIRKRGSETTRKEIEAFCYSRFQELEVNVDVLRKFRDKYRSDNERKQRLVRLVNNASARLQKSDQADLLKQLKRRDAALISKNVGSAQDDVYDEIRSLLQVGGYQNQDQKFVATARGDSVFVYTESAGFPLAFIRNIKRYRDEAYLPLINDGVSLHTDYHDEKFTDLIIKDYPEAERTLEATDALLIGTILRTVGVTSDHGNAAFLFPHYVSSVQQRVAIETLKRNKDMLAEIKAETVRIIRAMKPQTLQRFYVILKYHVMDRDDRLKRPAGPFARTQVQTSEGVKTTVSPEYRAFENIRKQILADLTESLGSEEAVHTRSSELYEELDQFSELVMVNNRPVRLMKREFAPPLSALSPIVQPVKLGDQEIAALIAIGESNQLEFKSSARWDFRQGKRDKKMEDSVVKTIAAFLNTDGGILLIGVDDERNVIGLDLDYSLFGKRDSRDAYENFLTTLLLDNLGKDTSPLISISIHQLDGKDVTKVAVRRSPKPVYVKDVLFYIRSGNSTRELTTKEAIDYFKNRGQIRFRDEVLY